MVDRSLFLSADHITFDGKRAVPSEEVTKLMLELADLQPGEKVLEIGTGSGYQTLHLVEATQREVVSIDPQPYWTSPLWNLNHKIPASSSVDYFIGDGTKGYSPKQPYDCIFVTCGMTSIPPAYEEQLREGGRLIIPLGKPDGQELLRLEKRNGKLVMGRVGGYARFQMAI